MTFHETSWKNYAPWIKEVKTGMKSFVEPFGQCLDASEGKAVQEGPSIRRKLPKSFSLEERRAATTRPAGLGRGGYLVTNTNSQEMPAKSPHEIISY